MPLSTVDLVIIGGNICFLILADGTSIQMRSITIMWSSMKMIFRSLNAWATGDGQKSNLLPIVTSSRRRRGLSQPQLRIRWRKGTG